MRRPFQTACLCIRINRLSTNQPAQLLPCLNTRVKAKSRRNYSQLPRIEPLTKLIWSDWIRFTTRLSTKKMAPTIWTFYSSLSIQSNRSKISKKILSNCRTPAHLRKCRASLASTYVKNQTKKLLLTKLGLSIQTEIMRLYWRIIVIKFVWLMSMIRMKRGEVFSWEEECNLVFQTMLLCNHMKRIQGPKLIISSSDSSSNWIS